MHFALILFYQKGYPVVENISIQIAQNKCMVTNKDKKRSANNNIWSMYYLE